MTTIPANSPDRTPEAIRRALWENESAPNGLLRNARAEELTAAAEATGDRDLLRQALFGLVKAYEFSSEAGKLLVPFARLMQEWDRDPSAFDRQDSHAFHWMFKWASSGMLGLPDVPLASMERWLAEMEYRYRVAGYSERAVRQSEFHLADDTGDTERADRAFAAWTAADRDAMANCHACEINAQGAYWADRGQDEEALRVWEPVLEGGASCMEEPHRVLAKSLLPLVRTGRVDQARAHHLRGYRMARGNESLLPTVARHIEFCALTGNEARGLELLSDHAAHLSSGGDPGSRLDLLGGTLVLLRRLLVLGHGDRPAIAHEGRRHTVRELHDTLDAEARAIAERFDERNGNTYESGRLRARLEREPLLESLPLGVRTDRTAWEPSAPAAPVPAPGAAAGGDALPELVAEARELRAQGHPRAAAAWERVEQLVARSGEAPDERLAADLLDARAVRAGHADEDGARELFERVASAHRSVGEPGRAVLAELRLVIAAVRSGAAPDEVRRLLASASASAEALDPDDPSRARRIATAALTRVKLSPLLTDHPAQDDGPESEGAGEPESEGAGEPEGHDRHVDAELAAFVEEFSAVSGGSTVEDLLAEAESMRAALAWRAGAVERAEALLASAARRCADAGRPWEAADPGMRLARLLMDTGRLGAAEDAARTALAHGSEIVAPEEQGALRLTLAEALYRQDGKEAEAADHALRAAHWFDAAGDSAGGGAYARLVLAQSLGETGRAAEAAEVLESALPELLEHGEERAVRARDTLARSLRALGDHRAAAEQYVLAAEVAKGWDDPGAHAHFASLAAECLSAAGLRAEAVAAYRRVVELWQEAGAQVSLARALRSLAWLEAEGGDRGTARELMARALDAVRGDAPELLLERARTWAQTAELLLDELYEDDDDDDNGDDHDDATGVTVAGEDADAKDEEGVRREVVALLERAEEAFAALGPDVLEERVRCVARLAWTLRDLGAGAEPAAPVRALIAEVSALDSEEARAFLPRLESLVGQVTRNHVAG
ncbi:tetratricopeptide repeat protein [Streptomyces sp. NPDC015131]|uniref:tetratricopeptide repeat protein n=1 Tax=Streptomyces sp. NPDC015131 TaxID=3364941 RepID=UPI0036F82E23